MTTARKTVLIIASVLVAGGLAIAFGAFAAAGFDIRNLSNDPRDWEKIEQTFEINVSTPYTSINVYGSEEDVRFEHTDGDHIEVAYWDSAQGDKHHTLSDEAGVLSLTSDARNQFLGHIGLLSFAREDRATVIKVPSSYTGTITVKTQVGETEIDSLTQVEALNVFSDAGYVSVKNTQTGAIELRSSAGGLEAVGIQAEQLIATNSAGSVYLHDIDAQTLEVRNDVGNIEVSEVRAKNMVASTKAGSADLSDIVADSLETTSEVGNQNLFKVQADTLTATSSMGAITARALTVSTSTLEAQTGNVSATFTEEASAYVIDAQAQLGSVHTPEGAREATKHITARATTGNIDLAFGAHAGGQGQDYSQSENSGSESDRRTPQAPAAPTAPEAPAAPAAPKN